MKPEDIMRMCVQNLLRRKSRTFLTMLGVLIGCCSIVIMISIGLGTAESQRMMLEQMGDLTIITVTPRQTGSEDGALDDSAVSAIKAIPDVVAVTPKIYLDDYGYVLKLCAGVNDRYVAEWSTVVGIDTKELEQMGYKLMSGRNVKKSYEVLAGRYLAYSFADTLRPAGSNMIYWWDGEMDEYGNMISSPDPYFEVTEVPMVIEVEADGKKFRFPVQSTGVLKEDYVKGYETAEGLVMSIADIKSIISEVQGKSLKKMDYRTVIVKVSDITKVAEAEKSIRALGFSTSSMESIREPMEKEARQKQLMLGGLGGISLFVAALGITNTMIMSISERTREIGIMKSLGCYVNNIRVLFLAEAGTIGFIGGVVGGIISMIIAVVINLFSFGGDFTWENLVAAVAGGENITRVCVVPPWLLLAAIVFSIFIGLVSGYYPANKAVKISALEAIKTS